MQPGIDCSGLSAKEKSTFHMTIQHQEQIQHTTLPSEKQTKAAEEEQAENPVCKDSWQRKMSFSASFPLLHKSCQGH